MSGMMTEALERCMALQEGMGECEGPELAMYAQRLMVEADALQTRLCVLNVQRRWGDEHAARDVALAAVMLTARAMAVMERIEALTAGVLDRDGDEVAGGCSGAGGGA